MKAKELDILIEETISKVIKDTILEGMAKDEQYEVYHINCEGEPVETCHSQEEADEIVNKLEKEYPGKQFIIEKGKYESHSHMLDKLDEMGEQLEEKENTNMENTTPRFKSIAEAIHHAKEQGHKKIKIDSEIYDVDECWNQMEQEEQVSIGEESHCEECGSAPMEEDLTGNQDKIDANHNGEIDGEDFDILRGEDGDKEEGDMDEETMMNGFKSQVAQKLEKELGREPSRKELIDAVAKLLSKQIEDDEDFINKHEPKQETDETYDEEGADIEAGHSDGTEFEDILRGSKKKHNDSEIDYNDAKQLDSIGYDDRIEESKPCCNECGGMITEEGMCNECGAPYQMEESKCEKCGKEVCECGSMMNETKKKTLRLSETEMVALIAKMVSESIPGLEAYNKAHKESGKQNADEIKVAMDDVNKNHISIEGSDNPEFPHQNGKGEKVAIEPTKEDEKEIEDNRGRNPLDLDYDIEPSEQFKKRLKMAIEGDKLMGNAATTTKTNVKPSNGAKLGKEANDKDGNNIPTPETGKKFEEGSKRKIEIKKNAPLYNKEVTPVKHMNETKTFNMTSILEEEIKKMKKLTSYDKKTQ